MKRIIIVFCYICSFSMLIFFAYKYQEQLFKPVTEWYEETGRHLLKLDRQTQPFGHYKNGLSFNGDNHHYGVDYHLPEDTPILAASDGTITRTMNERYGGKMIELQEADHTHYQWYGHLNTFSVKQGDTVRQGDIIGKSGNTGEFTTGPHLHFQRMKGGIGNDYAIDPEPYVESLPDKQYSLFHIEW
ncbi:M23 family peptidase [Staphylococcus muscae]|uniref:lysostaphin n=2 Tax=Staphylococcus muscae TaxID=1294 RepID=A0A240C8T3_9STAP|nr:M23 family metallopeptidase [Staphylococcus muscae]AVQ33830.1 M23 family peptidase [Staphylococcus muscae]PNZ06171.1 M23 family peptidase [Staphylococcus muscae]SNW04387.1 M23 family peptidase [Staphylococcus muscae]